MYRYTIMQDPGSHHQEEINQVVFTLNPNSRSPKVTYRVLAVGALVLLAYAATVVDVDLALAQVGAAVEASADRDEALSLSSSAESSPDRLGETAPIGHSATVAPCAGEGCSEGCTSGKNCWAYAKCEGGTCMPTVRKKNCRGNWMQ